MVEYIYQGFSVVFMLVFIAGIPSFVQYKGMVYINIKNFKIIKVKKMKFMFRALYGGDVSKDGVILPSYIFQAIFPLLALCDIVAICVMAFFCYDAYKYVLLILAISFVVEIIYYIVLNYILYTSNIKRECKKRKCTPREYRTQRKEEIADGAKTVEYAMELVKERERARKTKK